MDLARRINSRQLKIAAMREIDSGCTMRLLGTIGVEVPICWIAGMVSGALRGELAFCWHWPSWCVGHRWHWSTVPALGVCLHRACDGVDFLSCVVAYHRQRLSDHR